MKSVSLYIDGNRVDLNGEELIMFNYTQEDLSNPTVVKNSYSNKIKIAGTRNNNRIFSHVFRLDSRIDAGFDPMRKTPFELFDEAGSLLESGYIKLDEVNRKGKEIEYSITMYGGLGSFFYSLTYDSEGNKRTLEGMRWLYNSGEVAELGEFKLTADLLVNKAWKYIKDGNSYLVDHPDEFWDILNFAPCYNGYPADFDAKKVLYASSMSPFNNVIYKEGDVYFYRKTGCSSILATLANNHTEWEVRNIRPYLQRPVVRMSAILNAIIIEAKANGYNVELDSKFFKSNNRYNNRAWVTLPLLKKEDRYTSNVVSTILKSSLTPCDYLLSYAKMCGLIFLYDRETKTIKIQSRNTFYGEGEVVDLTGRIDGTSVCVKPIISDSKWYQLGGNKVVGEAAENYKQLYGREYGSQLINTGFDFNSEVTQLTKDFPLIEAVDVTERNYTYAICYTGGVSYLIVRHPLTAYETIKKQFFEDNGEGDSKEVTENAVYVKAVQFSSSKEYLDWLPKVQFHSKENKSVSGEHCMVFLAGSKVAPTVTLPDIDKTQVQMEYYVNDDHPDTQVLNSGDPCWNLDKNKSYIINELPSFRRVLDSNTWDWGLPREIYTGESMSYVKSLYDRYWRSYLVDRYDVNTKLLKCKVNLQGMLVNQNLMRKFFWFEGSLWVLNKISNYSVQTNDLTECEFVRVNNIENYTKGQNL
jgi:hypothetical protein